VLVTTVEPPTPPAPVVPPVAVVEPPVLVVEPPTPVLPPEPLGSPPPLDEQPAVPKDTSSALTAQIDNSCLVFMVRVSPLCVDLVRTLELQVESSKPSEAWRLVTRFA
jgi:hypothetical protein